MKTLFFSLFLLTVSLNTVAQLTWCPPGATWHNNYGSIGGEVGYVETKYTSDTVVAGMNCKKLIEHQQYRYYPGGPIIDNFKTHFTYEEGGVIFMFYLSAMGNGWDTLFNFNTPVNGKWFLNATDTVFVKVFGAGTNIINGDTLQWRAINFVYPADTTTWWSNDTLYERIGLKSSHFGFVNPMYNYDLFEPSIGGLCNYYDDTFALYGSTDSICTQLPTGIADISSADHSIRIFPNPVFDQLTFEIANSKLTTVFLYDIYGKQVLQRTFTNAITLSTAPFADGIYFYELRNINSIITSGKIIKQ